MMMMMNLKTSLQDADVFRLPQMHAPWSKLSGAKSTGA